MTNPEHADLPESSSWLRRPISRRSVVKMMGYGSAAAFLAACSSTPAATTAPSKAPASSAASSAPSASAGPKTGGQVIIASQDSIQGDFDPRTATDNAGLWVKKHAFLTLLGGDAKTGTFTPLLAAEMPTQESTTSYLIKLRQDVTFHDGSPVTAEDVKFTMDTIQDPATNSLFLNTFKFVDGVEVVDQFTCRFKLKQPFGAILDRLATIAPVSKKSATALGQEGYRKKPIGCGPFMVDDVVPDEHVTLKRYDGYKVGPKPLLDSVMWKRIPDANARITALQTSQVDIVVHVPPDLIDVIGNAGVVTGTTQSSAYDQIDFNCGAEPFNDERVRRAIAHTIDRDELIKLGWGGKATPATGALPPWHPFNNPNGKVLEKDLDKAKKLLADAGYPNGLTVEMLAQNAGPQLTLSTVLQAQWAKVGITVNLRLYDGDSIYDPVFKTKQWQCFQQYGDTGLLAMDPDIWYRWLNYGSPLINASDAQMAEVQKMIDDAAAIPPDQKDARIKAYYAIQDYLADGDGTAKKDGPAAREVHIDGRFTFNAWRDNIVGFKPAYNNVPDMTVVSKG